MQEEQYFRQKSEEIINSTALRYLPLQEDLKYVQNLVYEIALEWDDEINEQGIETLLADYRKNLVNHKEQIWVSKNNVQRVTSPASIPSNGSRTELISQIFLWVTIVKIETLCIELLEETKRNTKVTIKGTELSNTYSQRQVAIACFVLDIKLTEENGLLYLAKYTKTKSVQKFLTKRIYRTKELTEASENKSTNTKHLNDLMAATRLIRGIHNPNAEKAISQYIKAFESSSLSKR